MAILQPATMLFGMKSIETYTGRNRKTIKKWIASENFPAVKVDGRWESDTDLIDQHLRRRIELAIHAN